MAQDIKKMFQDHTLEAPKLPQGHEARFETKLDKSFSEKTSKETKTSFVWLKVAAIVIVLLGVGFFGYQQLSGSHTISQDDPAKAIVEGNSKKEVKNNSRQITLADISPDLKKVEEFYMTGINLQLASLKITKENKDLVDGYMGQLAELDKEYTALNAELSKVGPTESTITALIDNLKLRLDLLFKLKNKLKELKNQNNDEFKIIET